MLISLPANAFDRESLALIRALSKSRNGLRREFRKAGLQWVLSRKKGLNPSLALVNEMLHRALLKTMPDGTLRPTAAALRLIHDDTRRPADFRGQHAAIELPNRPEAPAINRTESAVHWLTRRVDGKGKPFLTDTQFAAAELIRRDFEIAGLGARVTSRWENAGDIAPGQGTPVSAAERVTAAHQRFSKAIEAIGPELSAIVIEVCCLAAGVEQAERRLSLPARAGKAVLKMALSALARHYGLIDSDETLPRHRLRSWGSPDFRSPLQENTEN